MKCTACGEENLSGAKFCSFCGAKLPAEPDEERRTAESAERHTAQPVQENPYQPRRMPTIYADASSAHRENRVTEKPAKVFLFDDEKEEEELRRRREKEAARKAAERRAVIDDPFFDDEDEDDEDDYDDDDEERSGRGRRIFAVVISIITVMILVVGAFAFFFYTPTGSRLRAYYGFAADADDYVVLGDWQLQNGNESEAAASYYNAFLLRRDDYDFSLQIAQRFERSGANERAEQLYLYLIDQYPLENDPYDYLTALFVRQGKNDEYAALLVYRAEHQPGYVAPQSPAKVVEMPEVSPAGGSYTGSVHISLSAEEGAEIYFTIDGSDPSEASRHYTGPIILYSGSYTLRAVAVANGIASDIFEVSYSVS